MNLLLLATEDWHLASHRLPLIRAARSAGYNVVVATRVRAHGGILESTGAEVAPLRLQRSATIGFRDGAMIGELAKLYRSLRPDIVHHVAMKPILYGGLAARLTRPRGIVQAFAGMGALYTSRGTKAAVRRLAVERLLRGVTRRPRTIVMVQNDDDARLVRDRGLARDGAVRVVRGSGVDLARFEVTPLQDGIPLVVLPARLLGDKGVREFIAAARLLRGRARFALVGDIDQANPSSCALEEVRGWVQDGSVEWWGHHDDMPVVLAQAHLVVLPSYREGMPKSLLEASASGRAMVTTDVPGCRDVVQHGHSGLLVPPQDATALAGAIEQLLNDPARLREFGYNARRYAEANFDDRTIAEQQVAVYQELLL